MQYRCLAGNRGNNIKFREAEAERAAIIIEEEIKSILDRFIYLGTRPVMVSLSEKRNKSVNVSSAALWENCLI